MRTIKERRKELVDALRSGEYRQGIGRMKREVNDNDFVYCPLGVACEIYRKHHIIISKWTVGITAAKGFQIGKSGIRFQFPPPLVEEFFGFSNNNVKNIATMNDWHMDTFDHIATWIENLNGGKNDND